MTINSVLKKIEKGRLSASLAKALRLAERAGDEGFATWCRLELGGYIASSSAMTEEVVVPEYRTGVGQHAEMVMVAL